MHVWWPFVISECPFARTSEGNSRTHFISITFFMYVLNTSKSYLLNTNMGQKVYKTLVIFGSMCICYTLSCCLHSSRLAPEGVDIVLDCMCGEDTNKGITLLKPMGKYILYGRWNKNTYWRDECETVLSASLFNITYNVISFTTWVVTEI